MVFEGGIDCQINRRIVLTDEVGVVEEEEIGTHRRICPGVDGNGTAFEGGEEVGGQVRRRGVGKPD